MTSWLGRRSGFTVFRYMKWSLLSAHLKLAVGPQLRVKKGSGDSQRTQSILEITMVSHDKGRDLGCEALIFS